MPWFITPTSPMSETNAASSSNSSQREASTTPSDNTLSQVHSPPNSHGPLTHSDKVHMLILLLQQETGVPIPGTAPNKQRNDVHDVSPRNLLNVEHESGDHITCADTVHVASVPSDVVADGDDNMSVSRCYWADSESNNDTESELSSPRLRSTSARSEMHAVHWSAENSRIRFQPCPINTYSVPSLCLGCSSAC